MVSKMAIQEISQVSPDYFNTAICQEMGRPTCESCTCTCLNVQTCGPHQSTLNLGWRQLQLRPGHRGASPLQTLFNSRHMFKCADMWAPSINTEPRMAQAILAPWTPGASPLQTVFNSRQGNRHMYMYIIHGLMEIGANHGK